MKLKNLNRMKIVATVALFALSSIFVGTALASVASPLDPGAVSSSALVCSAVLFGGQLALKYGKMPVILPGVHGAAIQQEIWVDRIVEQLFADNSVLSKVKRVDDSLVLGGSVVHIPQAGNAAAVVKNRAVFPGVVVQRTDTDITYPLDVFTSDPVLITNAEAMEISYSKVDSVLGLMPKNILNSVTNDMLWQWGATGAPQIMRTTGALAATNLAPGATGTRRVLQYADFVAAMTRFDDSDVPNEERYALLDAIQYGELLKDPEVTKMSIEKLADRAKGVVAELSGFKILKRSKNTIFTDAATPVKKAPGTASAATDNRSALFFQSDCLNCALGDTKFFETKDSAEHYGDIYSALIKAGGRQERADGFGVVSMVQASS